MARIRPLRRKIRAIAPAAAALLLGALMPAALAQTCLAPPEGKIAWYPGDGNGDDAISYRNGRAQAGTTYAPGQVGEAFHFDGINNIVANRTPLAAMRAVRNTFSYEFWARPTALAGNCPESVSGNCSGTAQAFAIAPRHGDADAPAGDPPAAGVGVVVGTNAICVAEHAAFHVPCLARYEPATPFNGWIHVAVVVENTRPRIYVDGVLVRTGLPSSKSFNHASWFQLGSGDALGKYAGDLDEVGIYARALTDAEILAIFQAGQDGQCKPACFSDAQEGLTDDLWDTAQGSAVTSSSALRAGTVSSDLFGTSLGSAEPGHLLFADAQPDGTVHSIEWQTPATMTAERFRLRAAHDPGGLNNQRAFREFRLFAFNVVTGQFEDIYSAPQRIPYGGGDEGLLLQACPNIRPLPTRRFRAEFVQNGATSLSGPRVYELDGLETAGNECGPPDLVAWYPGEGTGEDFTSDADGRLQGGLSFAPGKVGQAFRLDGVDDHVDLSRNVPSHAEVSVDAWIKLDADAPTDRGFAVYAARSPLQNESTMLTVNAAGRVGLVFGSSGGISTYDSAPQAIPLGILTHLAATYSPATGVKAYVNGQPVAMSLSFGNPPLGPLSSSSNQFIGQRQSVNTSEGIPAANLFKGLIDELHVFYRALTAEEVAGIFLKGSQGLCGADAPDADLACVLTDSADPVVSGAPLAYTVSASNLDAANGASGLTSQFVAPGGSSFVSASGAGWTCTGTGPVDCARPSLGAALSRSYTVNLLAPAAAGGVMASCSIDAIESDPNLANNSDTETTQVQPASAGTLSFTLAQYNVSEPATTVPITLKREGGSAGAVTVTVTPTPGTSNPARANVDFDATPLVATFADGDAAPKTLNLPIFDDTLDEALELISLSLSTDVSGTVGTRPTSRVALSDNDDPPTLSFGAAASVVNENGSAVTIALVLSQPSGFTVRVRYNIGPAGTATDGVDYTRPASQLLSIPAGNTGTALLRVTPVSDADFEGDETASFTLSAPENATLGSLTSHTLTIDDEDDNGPPGLIQFRLARYPGQEGAGTVPVTLTRTGGDTGPITVTVRPETETATAGADFDPTPITVTFADSDTQLKTLSVPVIDDATDEPAEKISLSLSTNVAGTVGARFTSEILLQDNDDPPTIGFAAASSTVAENGLPQVIEVRLSAASEMPVRTRVTVDAASTAADGVDYTRDLALLDFPAGTTSRLFQLTPVNDGEVEGSENAVFRLGELLNATPGAIPQHQLTLTDDDVPTGPPGRVRLAAARYELSANAQGQGRIELCALREGGSGGALAVNASLDLPGAAPVPPDTYAWPNGDARPRCLSVAYNSLTVNSFRLTLSPRNGSVLAAPSLARVMVQRPQAPRGLDEVLSLPATSPQVLESSGRIRITVSRPAGDSAASLRVQTVSRSAVAGQDFVAVDRLLEWVDGDTAARQFDIALPAGAAGEPEENFDVILRDPIGTNLVLGIARQTVRIVEQVPQ